MRIVANVPQRSSGTQGNAGAGSIGTNTSVMPTRSSPQYEPLNHPEGPTKQELSYVILLIVSAVCAVWWGPPSSAYTALAVAVILVAAFCMPGSRKQLLSLGVVLPVSSIVVGFILPLTARLSPVTMDGQLSALDHGASYRMWLWTAQHPALHQILATAYYGLPVTIAVTIVLSQRRTQFVKALVLAGLIGPLVYIAFPAVGPAHIGQRLAPRNCVPSLHVTWALLCLVYIRPRYRWFGLVCLALIAAATIGLGEHYLVDDVLAFPFAAVFCWPELV